MPDAKITALTELTTVAGEDLLAIVDDPAGTPVTKKITRNNLFPIGSPIASGTSGSVLFVDASGNLAQDNANFFWEDTANELLIGGTTAATADIMLDANGTTVFNEQGNDADFRIEGDTDTVLFNTNAGNNTVGIGVAGSTNVKLNVTDNNTNAAQPTIAFLPLAVKSIATALSFWGILGTARHDTGNFTGTAIVGTEFQATHNSTGTGTSAWGGRFNARKTNTGALNSAIASVFFVVNSNATGTLTEGIGISVATPTATGAITTNMGLEINNQGAANVTNAYGIWILAQSGAATINTALRIDGGAVNINESGTDSDTRIEGDTATQLFVTDAGLDAVRFGTTTAGAIAEFDATEITFNETGLATLDFRVEGDTDVNLLFADASADEVGIGLNAPAAKLHIDQSSTTKAIPVLTVDQADVSEEFIRFIGTSANTVLTQSIVEAADVATATIQGYLKIFVSDDGNQLTDQAYYLGIYTLA